jgi:hypothetical protein
MLADIQFQDLSPEEAELAIRAPPGDFTWCGGIITHYDFEGEMLQYRNEAETKVMEGSNNATTACTSKKQAAQMTASKGKAVAKAKRGCGYGSRGGSAIVIPRAEGKGKGRVLDDDEGSNPDVSLIACMLRG